MSRTRPTSPNNLRWASSICDLNSFSSRAFSSLDGGGVFAVRGGWIRRQWVLAWVEKGQALALAATPFDRRSGMASVELDTAGAAALAPPLRASYLGEEQARALAAELRAAL